jgi:excisionase family DNA binding protein
MSEEMQLTPPPFAVYIAEASKILRKSRTSVIQAVAEGKLTAVKDGRRTKITMASIDAYNAALPQIVFKRRIRKPRMVEVSRTRRKG